MKGMKLDEYEPVETLYEAILLDRYLEKWIEQAHTSTRQLSFTGKVTTVWGEQVKDDVPWGRRWWVVYRRLERIGREDG